LGNNLPPSLSSLIAKVGGVVEPEDIDVYDKLSAIHDRSKKLRTILKAWNSQQNADRELRKKYAHWILVGLSAQILLAMVVLFFIGFGLMNLPEWVAAVFFAGVFTEIVGLTTLVMRYLFGDRGSELLKLVEQI